MNGESDYPPQTYRSYIEHPCPPRTQGLLLRLIPYLASLSALVIVLWSPRAKPAPAAPPPPSPTFQIATIADCQFIIFSNPFFILHFPKCTNHGQVAHIEKQ